MKYTKEHEWIREDGTVGITDFAQSELGDVVFAELPKEGKEVVKGGELCVLESVKAVSTVYSPVSGTVTKVNGALSSSPELINKDAMGEGWIAVIKMKDPSELSSLMDESQYKKFVDELHT